MPLDHSKRVSAQENVDALKAWTETRRNGLAEWRGGKPVRRFLRARNVVTLLSLAGLMLSAAALLVLVGLGEAQIAASEGKTADLFSRPLFDIGGLMFTAGLILAGIAISANGSQGKALKEFPRLTINIVQVGPTSLVSPLPGVPPDFGQPRTIGLRITSRETTRNASLDFVLNLGQLPCGPLPPGYRPKDVRMPPIAEAIEVSGGLIQFGSPVHVGPQTTVQGLVAFNFLDAPDFQTAIVEVFDHNSGQWASIPSALGAYVET